MNSNFEIRRQRTKGTISGLLPAGSALVVGTPLMINSKDAATGINTFALANTRVDGFLTKSARTTPGLSADEIAFNLVTYDSGEIATPFEAGKAASIELADALEIEGSDYIVGSGTGAITSGTAAGSVISFASGKARVAQSNDWAEYRLAAQMTPVNGGACRLYLEKITNYKVA